MLALVGQPSLHGYYACMVLWNKGALWRNCRLKKCKTSFSPFCVFLCSRYSFKRWWEKVLWLLWVGGLVTLVLFLGLCLLRFSMLVGGSHMGIWPWKLMLTFLLLLSIVWFLLGLLVSGLGFVLGVPLLFGLLLLRSLLMLVMVVLGLLV